MVLAVGYSAMKKRNVHCAFLEGDLSHLNLGFWSSHSTLYDLGRKVKLETPLRLFLVYKQVIFWLIQYG